MNERLQRLHAQRDRIIQLIKQIKAVPRLPSSHPRAREVQDLFTKGKEIYEAAEGLSRDEQAEAQLKGGVYTIQAAELYLELAKKQE